MEEFGLKWIEDEWWGQAEGIAKVLSSPERTITDLVVRRWAYRSRRPGDKLHGMLPGKRLSGERTGTTWYRLADAAQVEAVTGGRVRSCHAAPTGGRCPELVGR